MMSAVLALGGVGGYFGGKIAQRVGETQKVYFIARGKHKEAIEKNGLELKIGNDSQICKPYLVTDDVNEVPNLKKI